MAQIDELERTLLELGLRAVERPSADRLRAESGLVILVGEQSGAGLRIEVRLLEKLTRNKLTLWHTVHQNNSFVPFGQFYLSPDANLCLGCTLAPDSPYNDWLYRVVFEMVSAAESLYKQVTADFAELPFQETELRANLFHLVRSELPPPAWQDGMGRDAAGILAEKLLGDLLGPEHVVQITRFEYGLTAGEQVSTLTIEQLPFVRKQKAHADWFLGLRTDIGILDSTDERLWIRLNRFNHESFMLTAAVRYGGRKPVLSVSTELTGEHLQHPELLKLAVDRQQEAAASLLTELGKLYRIQTMVNYRLGL